MRSKEQPIRLSLFAPDGRMGKAIAEAAALDPEFEIDNEHGDVLVDFSAPSALQASLDRAVAAGRIPPGPAQRDREGHSSMVRIARAGGIVRNVDSRWRDDENAVHILEET